MVVLPETVVNDPTKCLDYGSMIETAVNGVEAGGRDENGTVLPEGKDGVFGRCLHIEFEKAMRMIAIAKKKYAALVYDQDGSFHTTTTTTESESKVPTLYTRGTVVDKRDSCRAMKECYTRLLLDALRYEPFSEVLPSIARNYRRILDSNDPKDFEATVRVVETYSSTNCYMHVFTTKMAKRGTPLQAGSRVSYVIVTRDVRTRCVNSAKDNYQLGPARGL